MQLAILDLFFLIDKVNLVNRIKAHPILETPKQDELTFYFDGIPLRASAGDTVASALTAHGIRVFRTTVRRGEPRGLYCGIGQCTDCIMTIDGRPNVRTCVTEVKQGMRVETQHGLGKKQADGGKSDETR
jgi:predicted molibdopterin-dependent oxidoreductase YjgC